MKAFLSCIREYEGQEEKNEAKRYQILNQPLPDSKDRYFSSFSSHPWEAVPKEKRGVKTAAGAYQILYTRWDELLTGRYGAGLINLKRKMFSLGSREKKFTPELQDRMAVVRKCHKADVSKLTRQLSDDRAVFCGKDVYRTDAFGGLLREWPSLSNAATDRQ